MHLNIDTIVIDGFTQFNLDFPNDKWSLYFARNNVDKTWLIKHSYSDIDITIYFDELHLFQVEWFKDERLVINTSQRCFTSINIYHRFPKFQASISVLYETI